MNAIPVAAESAAALAEALKATFSPNTRRFVECAERLGAPSMPANPETVAAQVAELLGGTRRS